MLTDLLLCYSTIIPFFTTCLTIFSVVTAANLQPNKESKPDIQHQIKRDLKDVFNPLPNGDFEVLDNSAESFPKISIWDFNTERRAFIGDDEIFVQSKDDDNSYEGIDLQNGLLVFHPHKKPGVHKDIRDEKLYPPFRESKHKRDYEQIYDNIVKGVGGISKYISGSNNPNLKDDDYNEDESAPEVPNDITQQWGFYDYLKWLLHGGGDTAVNDLNNTNNTKEEVSDGRIENSDNNKHGLDSGSPDGVTDKNNIIESATILPTKNILPAVNPDILKVLLEKYKNGRMKRSINPESNMNLLINDNDEDDNTDTQADIIEFLRTDKDLRSLLIMVYYYGE